jgi:guanosine-3',5'-bis(diphosphate) 3'-pyrophosphohydrolase
VIAARIKAMIGNRREVMSKIEQALEARLKEDGTAGAHRQPDQVALQHLPQDDRRSQILRRSHGRLRRARDRDPRSASVTRRSAPRTGCTSRSTTASRITSRSPRPTVTSRCTRYCSARLWGAHRECRSAPRTWISSPSAGWPRTGSTRSEASPANNAQMRAREWLQGLLDEPAPGGQFDGVPRERQGRPVSGRGLLCSRRRVASWRCRAMPARSTSPTRCIPMSATTPWPRASTASCVRCARAWSAARRWKSSPRRSAAPQPQWLEFVVTSKARTAIRHYLKQLQHEDAVSLGHRMLGRALGEIGWQSLDALPPESRCGRLSRRKQVAPAGGTAGRHRPRHAHAGELVARQPAGAAMALPAAARAPGGPHQRYRARRADLRQLLHADPGRPDHRLPVRRQGPGGAPDHECPNVAEMRKQPERVVRVDWDTSVSGDYRVELRIDRGQQAWRAGHRLRRRSAQANSNIENVEYKERDLMTATSLLFTIEVHQPQALRRCHEAACADLRSSTRFIVILSESRK